MCVCVGDDLWYASLRQHCPETMIKEFSVCLRISYKAPMSIVKASAMIINKKERCAIDLMKFVSS